MEKLYLDEYHYDKERKWLKKTYLFMLCLLIINTSSLAWGETRIDWNGWWGLDEQEIVKRRGEPEGKILLYEEEYASVPALLEFRFQENKLDAVKITPLMEASADEFYDMYRQLAGQFTEHFGIPAETQKQKRKETIFWIVENTKIVLNFNDSFWILTFKHYEEE